MSRIYFGCIFRWEKPLHNSPTGTMVVGGTMTGTGRWPIAHSYFSLIILYVFHFYPSWREKEGQLCRNNSDCNWLHKDLKVIFTLCIKHDLSHNWRRKTHELLGRTKEWRNCRFFLAFTSPKHYSSVLNMSWASLPTPPGSTGTPPPSSASVNVPTTWIGTTGRWPAM